jgi:NADPH:quinone reductase-like Zn-dependent oxidoreductase
MPTTIPSQLYRQVNTHVQLQKERIGISKPTDVLIEIQVVALNFHDTNTLHETNPSALKARGIPCYDPAAIFEIGSEVRLFDIGDRVSPISDQHSITGYEKSRDWLGGEVDGMLSSQCVLPR